MGKLLIVFVTAGTYLSGVTVGIYKRVEVETLLMSGKTNLQNYGM